MKTFSRLILLLACVWAACRHATAQAYSQQSFQVLNLASHPRGAALGESQTIADSTDLFAWMTAPAMLNGNNTRRAAFGFQSLREGMTYSSATMVLALRRQYPLGIGIRYLNYGKMDATDASGQSTGTFRAADYVIEIGSAHRMGNYGIGLTAKWVNSQIAEYGAHGFAMDLNAVFIHPTADFHFSVLLKNIGFATAAVGQSTTPLPFDARISSIFKPAHMPVRFYLTLSRLHDWQQTKGIEGASEWLSHTGVGADILLHKAFQLQVGFDGQRNQSLRYRDFSHRAGWSLGFRLLLRRLQVSYALSGYQAGYPRHFWGLQIHW
ncbi:type IX secretion system protein PorQ [Thermonema rossianum]|uniref:type IX secretion system protein PorQ n=1 Tax=Thermonema rossianum TaxID=55505 RepID=UPI00056ED5A8|nr:type IX secretion system protein PorQ [Thermonema rossianum]